MKSFFQREKDLKSEELKILARKDYVPNRIQAYERAVLYLERIDPNNKYLNLNNPVFKQKADAYMKFLDLNKIFNLQFLRVVRR